MKKLILCASVALVTTLSYLVTAKENTSNDVNAVITAKTDSSALTVDDYISGVYKNIDFSKSKKLDFEVFKKAYYGYMNLKNEGKLADNKDVLTVCDFSKPSSEYRLWVIDLRAKKVLFNDYVAHGQGSGLDMATAFSNTENSHQTSLGFYVTADTYVGKHGTSLRMQGMDQGYNDAAYDRAVVVHGADYVSDAFVAGQKRLGRSWGCPAVSNQIALPMINAIKGGTCLFIYAPQEKYLSSTHWLKKKISTVPGNALAVNTNVQRDTVIRYVQ